MTELIAIPTPKAIQDYAVAEHSCRVISNDWVNGEYKLLIVDAPDGSLAARPGQFFHLACPPDNGRENYLRRPMSLHWVDQELRQLHFLYKVQGAGTRGLASLEPGFFLDAMGPVGRGFTLPQGTRHVLMVGRGVGLATLGPLAAHAIANGAKVTAILSARTEALVMADAKLRDVGADVICVTDYRGDSDVVSLEARIGAIHAEAPIDFFATCGSNRLLMLLQRIGGELGIPGEVALEQRMGCALGMCFACVQPFRCEQGSSKLTYRRVCWDGPVFNIQEAISW